MIVRAVSTLILQIWIKSWNLAQTPRITLWWKFLRETRLKVTWLLMSALFLCKHDFLSIDACYIPLERKFCVNQYLQKNHSLKIDGSRDIRLRSSKSWRHHFSIKFYILKYERIIYHWKDNFMWRNIRLRTISWKSNGKKILQLKRVYYGNCYIK